MIQVLDHAPAHKIIHQIKRYSNYLEISKIEDEKKLTEDCGPYISTTT